MAWRRDDDLLTLYAIASVAARFWTYHLNYSNLILAFLPLALWRRSTGPVNRWAVGLFFLVTASLWIPAKVADLPAGQVAEQVVWLIGLAGLLALPATAAAAGDGRGWPRRHPRSVSPIL